MSPTVITVLVIIGLIALYFAACLIIISIALHSSLGKRLEDVKGPCNLTFEDYRFLIRDPYETGYFGKGIRGFLYQDRECSSFKGFIILAHGFYGTHTSYLLDIAFLCKAGYQVLAYDQYGSGLSDGKNTESLATGIYVMENVIRDVERRHLNKDLPLFLYGHSWGAYCAVGASRIHPELAGVIARSAPVAPIQIGIDALAYHAPRLTCFFRPVLPFASYCLLGHHDAIKATRGPKKNKKTPMLLLHSLDDSTVSYRRSLAFYYTKHPQANVKVETSEHGGHNTLLSLEGQKNHATDIAEYNRILLLPEDQKTRQLSNFIRNIHRAERYMCDAEVSREILSFLDSLSKKN